MVNLNKEKMFKPPRGYLYIRPAVNQFAYECWFIPAIPFIYVYELILKIKVVIQMIGLYFQYVKQTKKKVNRE